MVKNLTQIFDESLNNILSIVNDKNYYSCIKISNDLITISVQSDYKDGIFIAEVLDGVFSQIYPISDEYQIDEEYQNNIKDQLKKQLELLLSSYKDGDKNKIYNALKDLRSVATVYQLTSPTKFQLKDRARRVVYREGMWYGDNGKKIQRR